MVMRMRMLCAVGVLLIVVVASSSSAVDSLPLFKYGGKTFSEAEIEGKDLQMLFEVKSDHYSKMQQLVDQMILNRFFDEEAKSSKKPRQEIEDTKLSVKDPTEKELKEFFDKNAGRMPYKFEDVKGELKNFLVQQKKAEKKQAILDGLKKSGKAEALLIAPVAPIVAINSDGFPFKGNADAKVTVVEFADYQCPHCGAAHPAIKKVADEFKDKIKFVYMDYPINHSGVSRTVAEGAVCANDQGKYWEYHDTAFEKQKDLTKDSPEKLAGELKLDIEVFKKCFASSKPKDLVKKSEGEAARVGVSGTPTIFINGQRITGAMGEKDLRDAIQKALKG